MKVILKADLKGTGKAGELINVSDGYAKNYLLPRGMAIQADSKAINELRGKEESQKHRQEMEKEAAEKMADKLKDAVVKVFAKAGQNGKLFGAVTSKEIAQAVKQQFDFNIDKRKIVLDGDIKAFGTYTTEIKLFSGITTSIRVVVGEKE
ncbi:MAG TPA: 50S ribosomal protein L9 [Clostridia bacterium]|nr:50S ribosomal protein L9 [Clostridia bacterium]